MAISFYRKVMVKKRIHQLSIKKEDKFMAMTMSEILEKMEKVGSDGSSQLQMRSEDLQHKQMVRRLPLLKNGVKKKSELLLEVELALPFNPETGEADEKFNAKRKYRPPFSATTMALALKEMAGSNEALKNTLMKRAGVSEWDVSEPETFTKADWVVFAKYRVPRVFTVIVTHVQIEAAGTGQFGRDYAVSVKRNEDGDVVGEMPGFLVANKFFRDRNYEELNAYNESIANGTCKDDDKKQKEVRGSIMGKAPVSDDKPANYVRLFEFPTDMEYVIANNVDLAGISAESIRDFEVLSRYKKGIRQAAEKYQDGSWKKFDKFFDFWTIEMSGPAEGDDSTTAGKAKIGLDTTFEKPTVPLNDEESYDSGEKTKALVEALREYIDSDPNLEKKIRTSMRIPVYDEEVEDMIYRSLGTVIDVERDEYITNKVITNNKDFILRVFKEAGEEMLEEIEAGLSERKEGNLDSEEAKKEAKSYDLGSDEFTDSLDFGITEGDEGEEVEEGK